MLNPILLDLPMPIHTPRLCIKPREPGEGKVLNHAICSSLEHLKPWMPFAQTAPTLDQSEAHCRRAQAEFLLRENFTLSIYSRDLKTFIGSTGFHRPNWAVPCLEIGYWICEEHRGQGYITEAANALTRYAFDVMGVRRLEIRCDPRNRPSLAVMRRLGFVQEGLLKSDTVDPDGTLRDTIVGARHSTADLPHLKVTWG